MRRTPFAIELWLAALRERRSARRILIVIDHLAARQGAFVLEQTD
jgi:hypothetical protein